MTTRALSRWRLEGKAPSAKAIAKLVRVVAPIDREAATWLAEAARPSPPRRAASPREREGEEQ